MKILKYAYPLLIGGLVSANIHAYPGALEEPAPQLSPLMVHGTHEDKIDIVIVGDGYATDQDQRDYHDIVQTRFMSLFNDGDAYWYAKSAFNIYRFDIRSEDSMVSEMDPEKPVGCEKVYADRDTVLNWAFCTDNEAGEALYESARKRLNTIQNDHFPWADKVVVIVNNDYRYGRAYGGTVAAITALGTSPGIIKHELGHLISGLADEYAIWEVVRDQSGSLLYKLAVNTTSRDKPNVSDDNDLKWDEFVKDELTVPLEFDENTMDAIDSTGYFALHDPSKSRPNVEHRYPPDYVPHYIPSYGGVMGSSGSSVHFKSRFNTVGFDQTLSVLKDYMDFNFDNLVTGDFNGDGVDEVMIHAGRTLYGFRKTSESLTPYFVSQPIIYGNISWDLRSEDGLYVGDFDGDGRDDLMLVNRTQWTIPYAVIMRSIDEGFEVTARYDERMPGWQISEQDVFAVGDLNGDNKSDLMVSNTKGWSVGYLGIFHSDGKGLSMHARYDKALPGWDRIEKNDRFYLGDVNGDGIDDIVVTNQKDWKYGYLGVLSNDGGPDLEMTVRFDNTALTWGEMRENDSIFISDIDGDGRDDISFHNCLDWKYCYFNSLMSKEAGFVGTDLISKSFEGWKMSASDKFHFADVNGDGGKDIVVQNNLDWGEGYLGILFSRGDGSYKGGWIKQRMGSWKLRAGDELVVAELNSDVGRSDFVIRQSDWLATIESSASGVAQTSIHRNYIYDHDHHDYGWW